MRRGRRRQQGALGSQGRRPAAALRTQPAAQPLHAPTSPSRPAPRSFRVDRRKYHPPPGVHGAVVDFRLLPPEQRVPVPDEAGFIRLVCLSVCVCLGGWGEALMAMGTGHRASCCSR